MSNEETEDLPRPITGNPGEVQAGETVKSEEPEAEPSYYDALLDILEQVKDGPLSAESVTEVLERHGLEGLMLLVSESESEIQEEKAAIDTLFDDVIDPEALSRELSS